MALSAGAIAGIVGGSQIAGGLLSGGLSAVYAMNQQKRAINYDREMYEKQRLDELDFWRRNNEYNMPSAQVQRLLSAGINPASQFGEGSVVGNSSSAPSAPSYPTFPMQSPSFIGDAFRSTSEGILRSALLKSQIELNNAKALEGLTHSDKLKAETKEIYDTLDPTIAKLISEAHLNDEHRLKLAQDIQNSVKIVNAQVEDIASEIEFRKKQGQKIDSDILLNDARINEIVTSIKLTCEQLRGLRSENDVQILYNTFITPFIEVIAKTDFDNAISQKMLLHYQRRIMNETANIIEGTGAIKAFEEIRALMAETQYTKDKDDNISVENWFKFFGIALGAFAGSKLSFGRANKIGY